MSEVTFAKAFLATLDKRPIKLPPDHVSDARKHPQQSPYILPKQSHAFPKRQRTVSTSPAAAPTTVSVTLRPMRSGETVTLEGVELDSTIHHVKSQYAARSNQPPDKIRLLRNKKPAPDLKTLRDLGVDGDVELSVMVMGGGGVASTPQPPPDAMETDERGPAPESERAQVEADARGGGTNTVAGILQTSEFWEDVRGFLAQRLRDQGEADRLMGVFQEAARRR